MKVPGRIFWVLASVTAWGCGDGDEPSVDSAGLICRGECSAALRCGAIDSLSDCVDACRNEDWYAGSRRSLSAAQVLGACFERLTCDELFTGDEAAWKRGARAWRGDTYFSYERDDDAAAIWRIALADEHTAGELASLLNSSTLRAEAIGTTITLGVGDPALPLDWAFDQ